MGRLAVSCIETVSDRSGIRAHKPSPIMVSRSGARDRRSLNACPHLIVPDFNEGHCRATHGPLARSDTHHLAPCSGRVYSRRWAARVVLTQDSRQAIRTWAPVNRVSCTSPKPLDHHIDGPCDRCCSQESSAMRSFRIVRIVQCGPRSGGKVARRWVLEMSAGGLHP